MYLESAPNFTHVALPGKKKFECHLSNSRNTKPSNHQGIINNGGKDTKPVPDKSGKVLIQFHSDFTFATW